MPPKWPMPEVPVSKSIGETLGRVQAASYAADLRFRRRPISGSQALDIITLSVFSVRTVRRRLGQLPALRWTAETRPRRGQSRRVAARSLVVSARRVNIEGLSSIVPWGVLLRVIGRLVSNSPGQGWHYWYCTGRMLVQYW